jgi:hypothetical protein
MAAEMPMITEEKPMASALRVPEDDEAELELRAKQYVLEIVQKRSEPITPSDLFAEVRQLLRVPSSVSLAQLAMWDLVSRGQLRFTSDYRLARP